MDCDNLDCEICQVCKVKTSNILGFKSSVFNNVDEYFEINCILLYFLSGYFIGHLIFFMSPVDCMQLSDIILIPIAFLNRKILTSSH